MSPWTLRLGAPAALLAVIVIADVTSGHSVVYDLLCAVPLLAALLDRPRPVLAWGGLCLVVQMLVGVYDHVYDSGDRLIAQAFRVAFTLATTVAAAALSARRLRELARTQRVEAAAAVAQQAILRPVPTHLGPLRLSGDYRATREDTLVGGDFYDAVERDDGSVLAVIGDVRGHGLPAVRLAADIVGAFRAFAVAGHATGEILAAMDSIVRAHGGPEDFATAAVVQVGPAGDVSALVAGHPPPLLLRRDQHLTNRLAGDSGGVEHAPPLGLLFGRQPAPLRDRLEYGDRLVLYTDGISEARDRRGAFFGLEAELPKLGGFGSVDDLPSGLIGAAHDWAHAGLRDDAAVLVLELDRGRVELAVPLNSLATA